MTLEAPQVEVVDLESQATIPNSEQESEGKTGTHSWKSMWIHNQQMNKNKKWQDRKHKNVLHSALQQELTAAWPDMNNQEDERKLAAFLDMTNHMANPQPFIGPLPRQFASLYQDPPICLFPIPFVKGG
jgi:hypothetical protein